jgi:hypothetical protein
MTRKFVYIKRVRWMELGTDGYYDLRDNGEPLLKCQPLLADVAECDLFVRYTLLDVARRDLPGRWPVKPPLKGIYTVRTGDRTLRGSDRALRIFVSVTAFRSCCLPFKLACSRVAEVLENELGRSKRGRPPKSAHPRDHASRAETVRSVYNRFRFPLKEHQLEMQFSIFCSWREWIVQANPACLLRHIERVRRDIDGTKAERLSELIRDVRERYGEATVCRQTIQISSSIEQTEQVLAKTKTG